MSNEIKTAPMKRLIKQAGAARVSRASAETLSEVLESIGLRIAKEAIDYAEHTGRKTVKERDIKIAVKKFLTENTEVVI